MEKRKDELKSNVTMKNEEVKTSSKKRELSICEMCNEFNYSSGGCKIDEIEELCDGPF